jgi:AraC-like DNA-binding protein
MRALGRYLEALDKPVGLIVNDGYCARQVAHLCAELGMRVPEEVGIVAALAHLLRVNRSTLYRRFEDALGKSPQDEINRLRVDCLKRETGQTPSAYREARMEKKRH